MKIIINNESVTELFIPTHSHQFSDCWLTFYEIIYIPNNVVYIYLKTSTKLPPWIRFGCLTLNPSPYKYNHNLYIRIKVYRSIYYLLYYKSSGVNLFTLIENHIRISELCKKNADRLLRREHDLTRQICRASLF